MLYAVEKKIKKKIKRWWGTWCQPEPEICIGALVASLSVMAEFTSLMTTQPHTLHISIPYHRDTQNNKDKVQLNKVTDILEKEVS